MLVGIRFGHGGDSFHIPGDKTPARIKHLIVKLLLGQPVQTLIGHHRILAGLCGPAQGTEKFLAVFIRPVFQYIRRMIHVNRMQKSIMGLLQEINQVIVFKRHPFRVHLPEHILSRHFHDGTPGAAPAVKP